MTRTELAITRFKEGFHCSQAVMEAWASEIGIDPMLARRLATPLAAGSGLGGECGAVSGAFLVIGWKYGSNRAGDSEGLVSAISKVHEFANRFKSLHGSLNCHDLIGLDVLTEQGYREFKERDLKLTRCVKYVEDTMSILDQLIP